MTSVADKFGLVADGAVLCVVIFGSPHTGFELVDLGRLPTAAKLEALKQKHGGEFAGVAGIWLNGKPHVALVNELDAENVAALSRTVAEYFVPTILRGKRDADAPRN